MNKRKPNTISPDELELIQGYRLFDDIFMMKVFDGHIEDHIIKMIRKENWKCQVA